MRDLKMSEVTGNVRDLCVISDIKVNTMASEEMENNSEYYLAILKKKTKGTNKENSCMDIFQDVYLSIKLAELNGEGFDETRGLEVSHFIRGRLSGYLKNSKYEGKEDNLDVIYASGLESEENGIDFIYANSADDYDLEEEVIQTDIEESLRYLVIEGNSVGVNILHMIKNPEQFVGTGDGKISEACKRVLGMIKEKLSTECLEELWQVLAYEDKGARTLAIEKIERELQETGELWGI